MNAIIVSNGFKLQLDNSWGIDVWFLIEAAMSGYKIKEIYLGGKEHTSFEAYEEDIGNCTKWQRRCCLL